MLRITPSIEIDGEPKTEFKKYQQDKFTTVAISRDELLHYGLPAPEPFKPVEYTIESTWFEHSILGGHKDDRQGVRELTPLPDGNPLPVARSKYVDVYEDVLRDCLHVLPDNEQTSARRAAWQSWCEQRPTRTDAAYARLALPDWDTFPLRPPPHLGAQTAGSGASHTVAARNTIESSLGGSAAARTARNEQREARVELDNERAGARRDALEPAAWCFVRMTYEPTPEGVEPGCQIPWILVRLPATLEGVDTTDENTQIDVQVGRRVRVCVVLVCSLSCSCAQWWEPKDRRYDGDWTLWAHTGPVLRGTIELTNVKMTLQRPNAQNGYRLNAASKLRLQQSPSARYGEYSREG